MRRGGKVEVLSAVMVADDDDEDAFFWCNKKLARSKDKKSRIDPTN
jgi:hypothetical protein